MLPFEQQRHAVVPIGHIKYVVIAQYVGFLIVVFY